MAFRSRLGCQIFMNKDLDDITVRIPSATRNLRVDGNNYTWIERTRVIINILVLIGSKPTHH
jgi:hypothetical protein